MPIDIKVPSVGESINEVTLVKWMKKNGEWVDRDEVIAELESASSEFFRISISMSNSFCSFFMPLF